MAQQGIQLDRNNFCCSICLDLLKDPVTIPCGHSYCMSCIKGCWKKKKIHSCPQCRETFTPRPVLVKSTMLGVLVEVVRKTGFQDAPPDHCSAGSGDARTGTKLKPPKSSPHYQSPTFEKHKLVNPSKKHRENICSRHDEVMNVFCRTDRQCICHLCCMDEHKGHDTVSVEAERNERQKEVDESRQKIQQLLEEKEKQMKMLRQEIQAMNCSADEAVEESEKVFTEMVQYVEKKSTEVKEKIRSQQRAEVQRVEVIQRNMRQEIAEMEQPFRSGG